MKVLSEPARSGGAPVDAEPVILALLPAHNEAQRIGAALAALRQQSPAPTRTVVVCDNCTDDTAEIAAGYGAEVMETVDNRDKKAGALNQALARFEPELADTDLVLVQDADTTLNPGFLRAAVAASTEAVGGVGGIFYGEDGGGLLGELQRIEFHRYATAIARKRHRAEVLTGTATLFRAGVLREIRRARRSGRIGGGDAYYSTLSLTEDDEITKAVRTLGYRTVSPPGCEVVTEVMPTVPRLWQQRLRWQRGALENLRDYGWNRVTAPYILRQGLMGVSVLFMFLYLGYMLLTTLYFGWPRLSAFWACIGAVFIVEKVVAARKAGWRAHLLILTLVVELVYDVIQHCIYVQALWRFLWRREQRWCAT
ncbi:glycosyltransferase family 2 protein [Kitasatospora paranensis]|uniref:Glycosyltransferase family 2 protein n=1 Tax=Kitasatospora paranensis TaxID=258053 RepID=A0ABW2G5J1_9ACTN